ncbi:hypothetical protein A7982_13932 [Minicystis rosea]|nr:hypothetical protein A7982_13932 [Minicystis rosea]
MYAKDSASHRMLAFDAAWGLHECPSLSIDDELFALSLVSERTGGPCFVAQHRFNSTLHVPGSAPMANAIFALPLSEDASWIGHDAEGLYRLSDGARLGPSPGKLARSHALRDGIVSYPTPDGPLELYPFHGGPVRRTPLDRIRELSAAGDSLFVGRFDGTVVELSASTLEERGRARFGDDVLHVHATGEVLLVETSDTLFVVRRLGDEPRPVARNLHPDRVVTSSGRWLCVQDKTAYASTGANAEPAFLRLEHVLGHPYACRDGVLFVPEALAYADGDFWTFLPWDLLTAGTNVVVPSAELTLGGGRVVDATVLLAGATILRLALTGGATATLPSKGNPLALKKGDAIQVELRGDGRTHEVERILAPGERATSTDTMTPLDPRTIVSSGAEGPPRWIAVLVQRGLVGDRRDVSQHLWRLAPVEALFQIYAPREGIARGFLHYDHRVWNDTDDPAADLAALAGAAALGVSAKLSSADAEIIVLRVESEGRRPKVSRLDIDRGLIPIVQAVNAALARTSNARRVYSCTTTEGRWAFVACTPDEAGELAAAGLGPLELHE